MQKRLGQGFLHYINQLDGARIESMVDSLEAAYARDGDFRVFTDRRGAWPALLRESFGSRDAGRPPRRGERGPPPGGRETRGDRPRRPPPPKRSLKRRVALLDVDKRVLAGPDLDISAPNIVLREISGDGDTVGWVAWHPLQRVSAPTDVGFLRQQTNELYFIAAIVLSLTVAIAIVLARHFVRPINALAAAAERLAAGEFTTRVAPSGADEIATLSRDFNVLAQSLEQNESARRRWVADISHELRTPLAVLRAEIEAMQDGVRKVEPGTLSSLHEEVLSLNQIVDDLYQLSLSDIGALNYRFETVELHELLRRLVAAFQERVRAKNISLELSCASDGALIVGDRQRLLQLFTNLLENSLRYTNAGGVIQMKSISNDQTTVVTIDDSPQGLADEHYDRLFERLYRVDVSRSREHGGSGLGLAICKTIADAHGADIRANPSTLGGVQITIAFGERV